MKNQEHQYYHVHLISDGTGDTLDTVSRAAAACYSKHDAIQHMHSLVRTPKQLKRVLIELEKQPGIVLFTLLDDPLRKQLEDKCRALRVPAVSVLDPVISTLQNFLNVKSDPVIGRQHDLNADYFRRMDALNFTLVHDDGQNFSTIHDADIILIGISRTSKTPTSIYLANRGVKVANIPIVPGVNIPVDIIQKSNAFVAGLIASTERIAQVRSHRLEVLNESRETSYSDRKAITMELNMMKSLAKKNNWPIIDVTRKSIEETAAAVMNLYNSASPVMENY